MERGALEKERRALNEERKEREDEKRKREKAEVALEEAESKREMEKQEKEAAQSRCEQFRNAAANHFLQQYSRQGSCSIQVAKKRTIPWLWIRLDGMESPGSFQISRAFRI